MSIMTVVTRKSSRGPLYHVGIPLMPRIPDPYLDCVLYLYGAEADAEDGVRTGGSGFLVGVPSEGLSETLGSEIMFLYAVTNKHVADTNSVIRMNTKQGLKTIMPIDERAWVHHPDGDDISACVISFDPNEYRFRYIDRKEFITKNIIDSMQIGPGDDVFTVGRFVNHEGQQRNLPTVRFGNISQMPIEPIVQNTGFNQESFLVEIKSIGGYSGSPVFVQIPIFSNRQIENWMPSTMFSFNTQPIFGGLMSHGPWLLGVDWGHINDWSPVLNENGKPTNANPKQAQVKLNTGMAAVVPAWKLAQLLDEGPLASHRKQIAELVLADRAKNPSVATND